MPATRFPARAAGPAERVAGFLAHLRLNGLAAGPAETADAVAALARIGAADRNEVRLALKALATGRPSDWRRFDDLFDAYWLNAGRTRAAPPPRCARRRAPARLGRPPRRRTPHDRRPSDDAPTPPKPGQGRLVASRQELLARRDLRDLADEAERREAERIAERLARAIRDRRARRRRAARRGPEIDLRRTLRRIPARGGEPIDLMRRRRREPPLRLVALLDVSGSMALYARVFLAFLKGLVGADTRARAFLFHTRIVEVTRRPDRPRHGPRRRPPGAHGRRLRRRHPHRRQPRRLQPRPRPPRRRPPHRRPHPLRRLRQRPARRARPRDSPASAAAPAASSG